MYSPPISKLIVGIMFYSGWVFSGRLVLAAENRDSPADPAARAATLDLKETESTITILFQAKPVVVYNKQSPPVPAGIDPVYQRSGFLHPVSSPGGTIVTDTFPFDHPHQHGIFSAWVKTSYDGQPVDFWNLAGGTGRVLHERVVSTFVSQDSTGFEVDLIHRVEGNPAVNVLRERWKVSVYPTDGDYHCFDLETTQQALTNKPLLISQHRYGGIALRGPVRWLKSKPDNRTLPPDYVSEPSSFLNNLRSDRIKGNHEHAKWVALSGTIRLKPVSVAVLCHADNFRAPQAARLHPKKPYFCFAPCVDGSFTIDKDHPFRARYRYVITDTATDAPLLDRHWQAWHKE